jgi:CheY-like chemotaxis protein
LVRRTTGPAVRLEVVGAGGVWHTHADPNQLENAILNLCVNARDAMPHGGRLTIETANKWLDERSGPERGLPPGQYVSICVSDTGCGMTPETIARAFDPFFTTKAAGVGTGLGLAMVYGFARQSNGHVRIYSEVGRGTTMCIYLPRFRGELEFDAKPIVVRPVRRAQTDETVLVVDDEPSVRMLVTEVLEDAGYRVIEASDGPTALSILESNVRIDLLITDVGLPGGLNGTQVANAGRVTRESMKVLFITGYAPNAVVANGHLDHDAELLTKPFSIEGLLEKITSMLPEHPMAMPKV